MVCGEIPQPALLRGRMKHPNVNSLRGPGGLFCVLAPIVFLGQSSDITYWDFCSLAVATPDLSRPSPAAPFRAHHTSRSAGEPRGERLAAQALRQFPRAGRARHIHVPGQAS
jgi:hypothetical protein